MRRYHRVINKALILCPNSIFLSPKINESPNLWFDPSLTYQLHLPFHSIPKRGEGIYYELSNEIRCAIDKATFVTFIYSGALEGLYGTVLDIYTIVLGMLDEKY
jgi:hypothetical protein